MLPRSQLSPLSPWPPRTFFAHISNHVSLKMFEMLSFKGEIGIPAMISGRSIFLTSISWDQSLEPWLQALAFRDWLMCFQWMLEKCCWTLHQTPVLENVSPSSVHQAICENHFLILPSPPTQKKRLQIINSPRDSHMFSKSPYIFGSPNGPPTGSPKRPPPRPPRSYRPPGHAAGLSRHLLRPVQAAVPKLLPNAQLLRNGRRQRLWKKKGPLRKLNNWMNFSLVNLMD